MTFYEAIMFDLSVKVLVIMNHQGIKKTASFCAATGKDAHLTSGQDSGEKEQ